MRNPLSVLASWQTVDLPVHRGRIPAGEELDCDLHRALEREPDVLVRQLGVLDWFFGRFHTHLDPGDIIRYEDVVESGGLALFRRLGHAGARPVALTSRNDSALYDGAMIDSLLAALLDAGGYWTRYYSAEDCERVANGVRRGRQGDGHSPGAQGNSANARSAASMGEDAMVSSATSSGTRARDAVRKH